MVASIFTITKYLLIKFETKKTKFLVNLIIDKVLISENCCDGFEIQIFEIFARITIIIDGVLQGPHFELP